MGQVNFLTTYNLPDTGKYKEIFPFQYETISLISGPQEDYNVSVTTYDANMVGITSSIIILGATCSTETVFTLGIGTSNLSTLCDLTGAVYYHVMVYTDCCYSIAKRKIVKNCSPYPNVRIMFLNRLGGFDYYNFNYDSKITVNMERKTYNKTLDWNYSVGDRGRSVLTIDAEEQTVINTDWISQYDYNFLQELATSPNVYVIDEDRMLKLPIIITDTVWDQKTELREKIFNMTLTYKYAYNINLQSY